MTQNSTEALVIQPQSYPESALLATNNNKDHVLSPRTMESSSSIHTATAVRSNASPMDPVRYSAKTDLIGLDNITYDTILASTTKGLHLDLNVQHLQPPPSSPLPSADTCAPPNTPISPQTTGYGSLASAGSQIMDWNVNDDVGKSQDSNTYIWIVHYFIMYIFSPHVLHVCSIIIEVQAQALCLKASGHTAIRDQLFCR